MSDGPPPAAGLSSKDEVKTPVFEKICKAIAEGLPLENDKLRTTDEGQARMKKFLSSMSEGTPFVSSLQDVKTYGLPNIVMNNTIEETWSYPGFTKGQIWSLEYELLH